MDIKAPPFPESVSEGTIAAWHVQPGEAVRRDAPLVDIETDKVTQEVVAPADGTLVEILRQEGETVMAEEVIATFEPGAVEATPEPTPVASDEPMRQAEPVSGPAARKLADEMGVDISDVRGSGRDGRITKEDVARTAAAKQAEAPVPTALTVPGESAPLGDEPAAGERAERRVPMTRLRASIARRLVEAQQNAAMLTTFNEVDMTAVMALRRKFGEEFQKAHNGTKLGFMSFFVRASVEALKRFPSVNASIDGQDIVYHGYFDIGVAVSTERGLVVPIVRDADALSLAQIEDQINDYGTRARAGKLTIEEMQGGTFTISNGGIFGSLLSTPILNPPQTGILGMHKIQERPVVMDGQIVARPMMYLALSYDHRLIDGREAVGFLVAIKNLLEDPARILLEL
ncbi:MAG: 2-oxoglutarate dehydrogenase complex dihydrolipoyllysine-residue succinyltransferase [Pseudomonadales bacterium]|nr:2-oxoglutarate dehydrogenase complex dihydrolipoyllysine-residue succinyltransferase [Pseudomonadales bacterium]MCP5183942.1 2-oxoglutarate dehydrogenase complex dihydrolipoyllysine-residue succinyltransferase [Pseudomonadales bacterium]